MTARGPFRLEIHVRPSSSRPGVGGTHGGSLVVRVTEPPDRGRATTSALALLAAALDVPGTSLRLVRGATARLKLVEITVSDEERPALEQRLRRLQEPTSP